MKTRLAVLLTIMLVSSTAFAVALRSDSIALPVIPRPAQMIQGVGNFLLDKNVSILLSPPTSRMRELASLFVDQLDTICGIRPHAGFVKRRSRVIRFALAASRDSSAGENYTLSVKPGAINVRASSDAGIFYAMETMLQLIRPGAMRRTARIPAVEIVDSPRFHWRGAHLDVCRHFFPKDFVKKYLDILAAYKINLFHWHLTDDQGWRIEIKRYPRLMAVGAWRADRGNLPWELCGPQKPGETATYGGFYTQDDIREIVQYAKQRCITILPEIEMPAHAQAAIAAYPELSCMGVPRTVPTGHTWPDTTIFCAGNDSTFAFLENVLTEVIDLFPGKFIHVGGDEADKTVWRRCPRCQARIISEGLKDVGELQSYFIKRIEKFLVSKGRRLIGWDEILEGGLPPEATVMSWRGIVGGIAAARAGHDVVMSPTSACYFDYYQGVPEYEPLAIGGYVPAKTVYAYEPVPDSLNAAQAAHVLGAQGNLWTEYVPTPEQAEYMLLPRLAALAEVVWSPRELRDWNDFSIRLLSELDRYKRLRWNGARSVLRARAVPIVDTTARTVTVTLESEMPRLTIRYTLDGSDVIPSSPVYTAPIAVDRSFTLRAATFSGNARLDSTIRQKFANDLASFRDVDYTTPWSRHYPAGGRFALVDNVRGGANHMDGLWQGFARRDVDLTVDLGATVPISRVAAGFLQNLADNIFFPDTVWYSVSDDNVTFSALPPESVTATQNLLGVVTTDVSVSCQGTTGRYVKVHAKNVGTCPVWHPNAGADAWLFLDEIVVE